MADWFIKKRDSSPTRSTDIEGLSSEWNRKCMFVFVSLSNLDHMMFVCLWCLTTLSIIFQLYHSSQFYWWRRPEYPEKTIDLLQVTDKLYHIIMYRVHLARAGCKRSTSVVIGNDCVGSCKSNYHAIMATTAPLL